VACKATSDGVYLQNGIFSISSNYSHRQPKYNALQLVSDTPHSVKMGTSQNSKYWNGNLRYAIAEPAETSVHYYSARCCHRQDLSLTTDSSEIDRRTDDKSNNTLDKLGLDTEVSHTRLILPPGPLSQGFRTKILCVFPVSPIRTTQILITYCMI